MLTRLLQKFEKEKNEKNYGKICKYLNCLVKTQTNYKCYLTDDHGVLIYHSKEKNSWKRYNAGKIRYHSVKEANISNLTEKRKNLILLEKNKIIISVKLGSTFTQAKNFANTPLGEAIGITTILAFLFAGGYFAFKDMEKELFVEKVSKTDEEFIIMEDNDSQAINFTNTFKPTSILTIITSDGTKHIYNTDKEITEIIKENFTIGSKFDNSRVESINFKPKNTNIILPLRVLDDNLELMLSFIKTNL